MRDQRGGIISKLFFIPLGLALMAGFFFLGYYIGKYESKAVAKLDPLPSLPEIADQYLPKKEDFTFHKSLTEKGDKIISLDVKYGSQSADDAPRKAPAAAEERAAKAGQPDKPEGRIEIKLDKPAAPPSRPAVRKEPSVPKDVATRLRYTIQIASYPERAAAEDEVKTLKKRGYAAFVVASELPGKGMWYRVRLGSFSNRASAEKLSSELRSKVGLTPFITIE